MLSVSLINVTLVVIASSLIFFGVPSKAIEAQFKFSAVCDNIVICHEISLTHATQELVATRFLALYQTSWNLFAMNSMTVFFTFHRY